MEYNYFLYVFRQTFSIFTNKITCKGLATKYMKRDLFKSMYYITNDGTKSILQETLSREFGISKYIMWSDCKHFKTFNSVLKVK